MEGDYFTFYENGKGAIYKEKKWVTNPTPEKLKLQEEQLQLKWKALRIRERRGDYGTLK